MLYCFLDTNILMQFEMLDQIDWHREFGESDICLMIPYDVIGELDKHKNDSSSGRRRRIARGVLPKIESWASGGLPIRDNTVLKIPDEPTREWLRGHGYDHENLDDRIIASADYFKKCNSSPQVILVADDTGLRLKAKSKGIESRTLPEELRRKPEPDPSQKELEQLRRENEILRNARPKIRIGFRRNDHELTNQLQIEYVSPIMVELPDLERMVDERRASLEFRYSDLEPISNADLSLTLNDFARALEKPLPPSEAEVSEYSVELEKYLKAYREYLEAKYVYQLFEVQTNRITISLDNIGNVPAEDIDVFLSFPEKIRVRVVSPFEPGPPAIPHKPKPRPLFEHPDLTERLLEISMAKNFDEREVSWPVVENKGIGLSIQNHTEYLKQRQSWMWKPLYLTFDSDYAGEGFEIPYEIVVANLPEPILGKLNIVTSRVDC